MQRLAAFASASVLALFATTISLAQTPTPAAEAAGFRVYERACGACHNGGDETAPPIERLQALGRDRVLQALQPGGVMASQAASLSQAERGQVAAFVTLPAARRTQLAAESAAAAKQKAEVDAKFPYPTQRVRDPRDSAGLPATPAWPAPKLGDGPFDLESWEQRKLRAVVAARGINSPRDLQFLPDGTLLVVERAGRIRLFRNGRLEAEPATGIPQVAVLGTATGFMDIVLHPDFARNGLMYLAYHKPAFGTLGHNVIYRGRWNGRGIVDGREIFVSDDVDALYTKMVFGRDGKLYATIGCPGLGTDGSIRRAQDGGDYAGKTLRLNDDGTIPQDNPFVGRAGFNPAVYTLGHRVNLGLAMNPKTGDLWVSEHGPNGGDELNILKAGQNYGWPLLNEGRYYGGQKVTPTPPSQPGLTEAHISFVPSIAPGDLVFYDGDKFPAWKGNLFMGAMRLSEAPRTGHLIRMVLNEQGGLVRSEMLLFDLHQRIRNVAQGPDGYLYVTTDEGADSVLMRLEPGA